MTDRHKELLVLSVSFLYEYVNSEDTVIDIDILELYNSCRELLAKKVGLSTTELIKYADSVYDKLTEITSDKDVEVNMLTLAIVSIMLILEEDGINLYSSIGRKLSRLTKAIYSKVEVEEQLREDILNTNRLLAKLVDSE